MALRERKRRIHTPLGPKVGNTDEEDHATSITRPTYLPPELLIHIFVNLRQSPSIYNERFGRLCSDLLSASHVCRFWRKTAVETSRLWSTIEIGTDLPLEYTRMLVERAANATTVEVHSECMWDSKEHFDILYALLPRASILVFRPMSVVPSSNSFLLGALDGLLDTPRLHTYEEAIGVQLVPGKPLLQCLRAPNLRAVTMARSPDQISSVALSQTWHLRDLTIELEYSMLAMPPDLRYSLLTLLRAIPMLSTFTYRDTQCYGRYRLPYISTPTSPDMSVYRSGIRPPAETRQAVASIQEVLKKPMHDPWHARETSNVRRAYLPTHNPDIVVSTPHLTHLSILGDLFDCAMILEHLHCPPGTTINIDAHSLAEPVYAAAGELVEVADIISSAVATSNTNRPGMLDKIHIRTSFGARNSSWAEYIEGETNHGRFRIQFPPHFSLLPPQLWRLEDMDGVRHLQLHLHFSTLAEPEIRAALSTRCTEVEDLELYTYGDKSFQSLLAILSQYKGREILFPRLKTLKYHLLEENADGKQLTIDELDLYNHSLGTLLDLATFVRGVRRIPLRKPLERLDLEIHDYSKDDLTYEEEQVFRSLAHEFTFQGDSSMCRRPTMYPMYVGRVLVGDPYMWEVSGE